ncbi:iron-sulfur cluster co-chaperone protein HscB isoform X2 [Malurus melanocephalus]|uniref:iron-sulfur cluster co-chaperone protein HscB isoform X2 n=1 Tax=Malurus melanocephalus TaxID=175006 RepID=UPI0025498395|nr:iron-sulfur cluster co-chaperone protein HscB isoform X2 [Malurus melanocephalus]
MRAALRAQLGWVRRALREAAPGRAPGPPCWSCGVALPSSDGPCFCPACQALQPPAPRPDLFRLMDCDRSFRIDAEQLQRRFRSLQQAVHPDRFGQRPPLELRGVEPAQETDCDATFLTEIMEINEKLAEPKSEDVLEEIETLIKVKQEELTREVTAAFERDDLQEAKKLLAKMKYFANLEDKLKAKKIPS